MRGRVDARVDAGIWLRRDQLGARLVEIIHRTFSVVNPTYRQRARLGKSVFGVPDRLYFTQDHDEWIRVPRGAADQIRRLLDEEGLAIRYEDRRVLPVERLPVMPDSALRDYQQAAVAALVSRTQGLFVGTTGSGKTRVGLGAVAELRTPALVLVGARDLAEQWRGEIRSVLRQDAGIIGAGAVEPAPVSVGLVQTVARWAPSRLDQFLRGFGLLIVDECLPADARVLVRDRGYLTIQDCARAREPLDVLSFNHESGEPEFRRIIAASEKLTQKRFVTITIRAGKRLLRLRVTEDHLVHVEGRGYVPAREIVVGTEVTASDQFYACRSCSMVFTTASRLASHVAREHAPRPDTTGGPGGTCSRCGRTYRTRATLNRHLRRHEDPALDAALREGLSKRMRENPPLHKPEVYERFRASMRALPKSSFHHLNGGNGRPPTEPEALLLQRLGPAWTWQLVVPTKAGRGSGYPMHYKLDIGNAAVRVGVEIDGKSHEGRQARERDLKKTSWLESLGWTVLRFQNSEVLADPEAVAKRIASCA
jgi:uncharacterized C2H2 Zn-finger protein